MAEANVPLFQIDDLHVSGADGGAEILRGVDLVVQPGEVHAVMGPAGSGTSTLAASVMGSAAFEVTSGGILLKGDDVTAWDVDVRAKAGMFLAFQFPQEIPGVSVIDFLHQALSARGRVELSVRELRLSIIEWLERLGMDPTFADRHLNERLSDGEKKRNEVLQMAILRPDVAILDGTDSGLDVDALELVARGVREVQADRPELGVVFITHHHRLLDELVADHVHVMLDGRIVQSGGHEIAERLARAGFDSWRLATTSRSAGPSRAVGTTR